MKNWNVILQVQGPNFLQHGSCVRYAMQGIALPVQISIIACDAGAKNEAQALHHEIGMRLGGETFNCGRPRSWGCMAWDEPSCRHVLVLMISQKKLNPGFDSFAGEWLQNGGVNADVLAVLCGSVSRSDVFPGSSYPVLSPRNSLVWGNSPTRIAETVMASALIDRKPGVFISYLRKEASAGAEQIHDALTHAGFRVFLDRFSGTPGRLFPHELAEAMADMGLVVLLETAGLRWSRWTMWEAAFARRYRIGPVAVNFNGAPVLHSASRRLTLPKSDDPARGLLPDTVNQIIEHIRKEHLNVAFARQAYYETLIRLAANTKGGDANAVGSGVLEIVDGTKASKGFALPSGAPGQLKHVRRLVEASAGGRMVLAGEHQHLSPADSADFKWLSDKEQVMLAGSGSVYRAVRNLLGRK